jgi:uncharacterized protein
VERAVLTARDPDALLEALHANVGALGSAVVAFSGGVDSSVVLAVAARALGPRALGLVGVSASLAAEELAEAREVARHAGAELLCLPTSELDDPDYAANRPDRCFHCKTGLYVACRRVAAERGLAWILNGTNADDLGDWRPGLRAADEAGVRSPLLEAGLRKDEVRAVARRLGLPNWDKPAQPCLASRLPYGTAVTRERLAAVEAVERQLHALGFREVRARHHGEEVRLEVEPARVPELLALAQDPTLLAAVRAAGFLRHAVQADGLRSGRLNDVLASPAGLKP